MPTAPGGVRHLSDVTLPDAELGYGAHETQDAHASQIYPAQTHRVKPLQPKREQARCRSWLLARRRQSRRTSESGRVSSRRMNAVSSASTYLQIDLLPATDDRLVLDNTTRARIHRPTALSYWQFDPLFLPKQSQIARIVTVMIRMNVKIIQVRNAFYYMIAVCL
jgi:hypothetical protein